MLTFSRSLQNSRLFPGFFNGEIQFTPPPPPQVVKVFHMILLVSVFSDSNEIRIQMIYLIFSIRTMFVVIIHVKLNIATLN